MEYSSIEKVLKVPVSEEKRRGGVKRYFTRALPGNKYQTCSVARKKGPRDGKTICSEPKERIRG